MPFLKIVSGYGQRFHRDNLLRRVRLNEGVLRNHSGKLASIGHCKMESQPEVDCLESITGDLNRSVQDDRYIYLCLRKLRVI